MTFITSIELRMNVLSIEDALTVGDGKLLTDSIGCDSSFPREQFPRNRQVLLEEYIAYLITNQINHPVLKRHGFEWVLPDQP